MNDYQKKFHQHVVNLQNKITQEIQNRDPEININEDNWERTDYAGNDGGGGITRAFTGDIFENAGVNTSLIHGKIDPAFAKNLEGDGDELWATGISLILHPTNPRVPTVHANFRMIAHGDKFWFGGGADLTPFYPHTEDFDHFHNTWQKACKPYDCYQDMKETCDNYFVNKHRNDEMRGVSGIFFDHFNTGDLKKDFNQVVDLSNHFIDSYFPIVDKRINEEFTEADVDFQLHRRGRYVEFNLLHDRGTLFGLRTNGRTDSILISLPARCKFSYKYEPPEGSVHAKMMEYYQIPN